MKYGMILILTYSQCCGAGPFLNGSGLLLVKNTGSGSDPFPHKILLFSFFMNLQVLFRIRKIVFWFCNPAKNKAERIK
jgi:hypothetical protein